MTFIPNIYSNEPICEKHNFKGSGCPMCNAELIQSLRDEINHVEGHLFLLIIAMDTHLPPDHLLKHHSSYLKYKNN